jgi:hypothetical protein
VSQQQPTNYLALGLWSFAIAITILMGVSAFVAGGPPTTPHVDYVRTYAGEAVFVVTTSTWCPQTPNSIDDIGDKLVWSAYEGGKPLAVDQPAAFYVVGGHGEHYKLAATLTVPLLDATDNGSNVTVFVRAQVQMYYVDYFSSTTNFTVNGNHDPPTTNMWGVEGQYLFNILGPLVASAAVSSTCFYGIYRHPKEGVAPQLSPRQRRAMKFLAIGLWLTLIGFYIAAVIR